MSLPLQNDFIDIHTHGSIPFPGLFSVETLMAHENRIPVEQAGIAYTVGIHPWFLTEENHGIMLEYVAKNAANDAVIAVGEAGFDKIKGPVMELQRKTFEEQVSIAEDRRKPVVIHCVRAWEELLAEHKKLKPEMPWLVHGFRGKKELALQLISKGIFLSFWFDFITRPEATLLVKSLPVDHIFFETDGSGADIRDIYKKVSGDLGLTIAELKSQVFTNFNRFFKLIPS
jgi:TatD DNase family protein